MADRKVVVIGVGLVTPLGVGVEENWTHVRDLKTGISRYRENHVPDWLGYYGKVKSLELPSIPPALASQMKFLNRGAVLGFVAASEAMRQIELAKASISPGRRALYIAAGDFSRIGYEYLHPVTGEEAGRAWEAVEIERLNQNALTRVNPFFLLESINNNLFSFLSAYYEFRGPNTSLATLSPYGSQALELACHSVRSGKADVALAVGYGNWIDEIPVYELEGLGLLSRCEGGAASFRPFDRSRDGFIPGEGGAAVLLAAAEFAQSCGGTVLATVGGGGNCIEFLDGRVFSVPPRVTERSMRMALEESQREVGDLGFIIGHGSGTSKGDRSELKSLLELTAVAPSPVPVCALKAYTGHMGAASDLAEVILGIKGADQGIVPATLNFIETEKEFSGLLISGTHQSCRRDSFLSVSYGLGGQSSALVLSVEQGSSFP
jgi:3-oxoacyl-[acyl-carrier-protein] synthase II